MNKRISRLLDYVLENSDNKIYLRIAQFLMSVGIPFNFPHGFKFVSLSVNRCVIKMPLRWRNKNHLGGAHACAIATLGELTSGTLLTRALGSSKYRVILADLAVDYLIQGRSHLTGVASLSEQEIEIITSDAEANGVVTHKMQTFIQDKDREKVAIVTTTWQFKDWSKTQTIL